MKVALYSCFPSDFDEVEKRVNSFLELIPDSSIIDIQLIPSLNSSNHTIFIKYVDSKE